MAHLDTQKSTQQILFKICCKRKKKEKNNKKYVNTFIFLFLFLFSFISYINLKLNFVNDNKKIATKAYIRSSTVTRSVASIFSNEGSKS